MYLVFFLQMLWQHIQYNVIPMHVMPIKPNLKQINVKCSVFMFIFNLYACLHNNSLIKFTYTTALHHSYTLEAGQ